MPHQETAPNVASPERIVYAGVGKTDRELDEALSASIRLFTVESIPELEAISTRAREMGVKARVALRVNPDVDAHTHAHITTGTATFRARPESAAGKGESNDTPRR